MAKLNATERRAIAEDIREELNKEIAAKNQERRDAALEKYYLTTEGKLVKKVMDKDPRLINTSVLNSKIKFKLTNSYRSYQCPIERRLILEQIDSKDINKTIEDIKKELKAKIK